MSASSIRHGDVVTDPAGNPHTVTYVGDQRLMVRDTDGCFWIVARRRLRSGSWTHEPQLNVPPQWKQRGSR